MRIETTPRGLMTLFFRQFWKFFITFFVIAIASALYAIKTPPVYESVGNLLIKFGADARPDVSKNENQQELTPTDRKEMMESYIKIIQSHDLLMGIIREFGVDKIYPKLMLSAQSRDTAEEMAYSKFMKGDLIVKPSFQGNIIEIHFLSNNPKLAPKFLNRLLEQFISKQADMFNKPQTDFIADQVEHAANELEKAQKKLQDFKARNGISSVEEEMNKLLQEKTETKTVALKSIDEAQTKVDELKAKETQLLMTYQKDSPAVVKIRESLSIARAQLYAKQADLKAGTNGNEGGNTVSPHIKDIDRRLKLLEGKRNDYNDLERQVKIAEDNFRQYTDKLEEARVKETLNRQNITRISILDEPTIPLVPIKPNRPFIILMGILGGLMLAIGMIVTFESIDERFSRPDQLSALLGVPVMISLRRYRRKPG